MRATFTPEQVEIDRTLAEMSASGLLDARRCLEHGFAFPSFDGALLAGYGQLGLPESAGGFGSSLVDLAIAVEALGRTLAPSRLPLQAAAIQVAAAAGIDVADAAEGRVRWTLAADEAAADGPDGWSAALAGGAASGAKTLVAHAGDADAIVAVLGDEVALLEAGGLTARRSLDPTRPVWDVELDGRAVLASGPLQDGLLRATVVAAADLCGAGLGAIRLGADYARERKQFGKPIGSFQGVAFQLVDAFVAVKAAWDLTLFAAWAVEQGDARAAAAVHGAKARAGEAALFASERCTQVHGGMGITREADPHLFGRRALASDPWLGSGRWHRRTLGRARLAAAVAEPAAA
ncbi:acyl-CoA dehydrogenase family protein [Conexibacter sp. JD483]|uniref:acyl-CoA dehydrogenase family protein n=1 Tax=unclassified Conexibacter TaxID=2627773 RepID=UPI00272550F8|nr:MULTISPECIES: acyl-CoA dehydrogenase family protein [unclassified Conexibacter]MDO8188737.1 acyl-CoA dehydrogenase family protein [Conexibacter sp. CPCC 205706]MDO8199889.1 acyl-CoA dehydrogenase family protein [Conexibacter sp. CPCC 205762]MDR9371150.1 acyl-CoA dehydrogenase family protein [Conexibacter sp. JD483]